jgi:hypothetical protein
MIGLPRPERSRKYRRFAEIHVARFVQPHCLETNRDRFIQFN